MDDLPEAFASKHRAVIIMPAGCGKTELVAKAVGCHQKERQLILTHTHAGVRSLRDRLRQLGVSPRFYSIDTIAGFALKYAASFPELSELGGFSPAEQDWDSVYRAATRVLSRAVGRKIIESSYVGLYVDEYQDCTVIQHGLIMSLADTLPCRIVGDPLQGIFDFGENVLIDWFQDILPHFERLDAPKVPWRWSENKALGDWLLEVRDCLMRGRPVDLRCAPRSVKWLSLSEPPHASQRQACFGILKESGSVVAIHRLPYQAHSLAQGLNGKFTSMEEVESKDLLKWSEKLERCTGAERAVATINFASLCMTKVSTELRTIKKKLEAGRQEVAKGLKKHTGTAVALEEVMASDDLALVLPAFSVIERIQGRVLYRHELWHGMKKTIREYRTGKYDTLQDAAWNVRNRGRIWGREVAPRMVARTLLIKGLEFDHSIVLNADELSAKELYVGMTRGSNSLTVLSSNPVLHKEQPVFGSKA